MKFSANTEQFAAARRGIVDAAADVLRPTVEAGLIEFNDGEEDWGQPVIVDLGQIWDSVLVEDEVDPASVPFAPFRQSIEESLRRTTYTEGVEREAQIERLSLWLAAAVVNAATVAAAESLQGEVVLLEWVTMQDSDVRELHEPLNGQQRPVGSTFEVGESRLHYPGEPVGPPEVWINCRCVVRPLLGEEMSAQTLAVEPDDDLDDIVGDVPVVETDDDFEFDEIPVHGVLAPVNVMSGDGRTLTEVTWADVPQALRWVKMDAGQHDGAVRVGTIKNIYQDGELIRWTGTMLHTPEADEAVNLMAEGPLGISVDLDSTTMEVDEELAEPGQMYEMRVTGRIRAATLVDIPAFVEAYAMLGEEPVPEGDPDEDELLASGCAPCMAKELDEHYAALVEFAISEAAWDGSASRFSDEEWQRSAIVDRGDSFDTPKERYAVPILEPNGDLSRAAVHAAAGRINQVDAPDAAISAGKRKLVAAYRRLDEEAPDSLTASVFAPGTHDGPGWITNPVDTQRLRNYWTRGAGAAKIRWGQPGDFNRCRSQLRKYVSNPRYLAGTCANLHFVALGVWPGRESTRSVEGAVMASAFTIYEETNVLPAEWFQDPELTGPTPVTVLPDGRTYGHIAQWGVCHSGLGLSVGMDDSCTAPPSSPSNYAYYRTGVVDTDQGEVPVGNLTMGIGHAGERLSANAAAAHYDNVNAVVADVVTGEDAFGIWFAGAMRPNLSDDQIRAFKASTLSGDWRRIGGELELVAALSVNVPGFPIPRLGLAASGGRQTALVAAGIIKREVVSAVSDVKAFVNEVEREMARRQEVRTLKAQYRAAERKRLVRK